MVSVERVARETGCLGGDCVARFQSSEGVQAETRRRVAAAARHAAYRPGASARTLRTQKSRVLGVVLSTLLNPVFAECLRGTAKAAADGGYAIVPMTTEYRLADEQRAVRFHRAVCAMRVAAGGLRVWELVPFPGCSEVCYPSQEQAGATLMEECQDARSLSSGQEV